MEFRAASRLPQAPAREGRKPVVCRTHNIWEPLPRLPENRGKPRTRGAGVLSLSAYATIWHRPLVPAWLCPRGRISTPWATKMRRMRAAVQLHRTPVGCSNRLLAVMNRIDVLNRPTW